MYVRERTWLERGPSHYRGFGQVSAPPGGIAPGSQCYDVSHDAGEVHCASISNVLLSAIPFNAPAGGMTTNCSTAETACFQTAPPAVLNALPTPTDVCSTYLGMTCGSLALLAGVLVVGLVLLKR